MGEAKVMELSQAELTELVDLIDDTIERKLVAIKEALDRSYAVLVGLEADEAWLELQGLIVELVKSDLALIRSRLSALLEAPPVEAPEAEAPKVEGEEPPAAEPAKEPEPEKGKGK